MPGGGLKSGLLQDDFLSTPGEYTHTSFEQSDTTSIQGLVWMPNSFWLLAHVACAMQLFAVGVAQFVVGLVVVNYTGDVNGGHCGAVTSAAAIFTVVAGICSLNVWRLFQPKRDITGKAKAVAPAVSAVEQTACRDPRRHTALAVLVALPLCVAAAAVDGSQCVTPLSAIEACAAPGAPFPGYPECEDAPGGGGSFACACASEMGGGGGGSYSCTWLSKDLPAALAPGGGPGGCDHLPSQLVTWLQISAVLSAVCAALLAAVAVLGALSAASSPACFRAVVLARHEESRFDAAGDDDFALEFTSQGHRSHSSRRGSAGSGADLF